MELTIIEHDIRPEDTLVFLHIPKTGGITLGAWIDPMWLPGARCPEYLTFSFARLPREEISTYHSFVGHLSMQALRKLLPAGFQCITLLREPLARHLSFLKMLKWVSTYAEQPNRLEVLHHIGNPLFFQILQAASQGDNQTLLPYCNAASLEQLIEDEVLQSSLRVVDMQTSHLSPLRNPPSPDARQEWFDQACQTLSSMTCIGLTERFQDSLFLLSFVFGWQSLPDTLRHNQTSETTGVDSLPSAAREKLASYNQYDLELYAFAQQEFQKRFDQMCRILLKRYGSRAQAHRRLPLPLDELVELLEAHYRQRFIQRQTRQDPLSGQTRFTFDSPVSSATGWQRREVSPTHGSFRWTGPGTTASVDLSRPSNVDLRLRVAVLAASRPELMDGLRVSINQEPLSCHRLDGQEGEMIFEVDVPASLALQEPFLRLSIETQSTAPLKADDPTRTDPRHVGLAVKWVELNTAKKEKET